MNKKDVLLLILTVICFIVALLGSVFAGNNSVLLNIVICSIILVCIIIQIIAILREAKKK